jgi:hypothetical protein
LVPPGKDALAPWPRTAQASENTRATGCEGKVEERMVVEVQQTYWDQHAKPLVPGVAEAVVVVGTAASPGVVEDAPSSCPAA